MKEGIKKETKIEEKSKRKHTDTDSDENTPVQKKIKQTPKQKPKKKNTVKETKTPKRKRIMSQDDSESDDIFASDGENHNMEDEDIVVSDNEAPPPLQNQLKLRKRKIRKAGTETIRDDEVYIQTVNKFVYESASEEDVEEEKGKENNKQKPNKPFESKEEDNNPKKIKVSPTKKGQKKRKDSNQKQITSWLVAK